jgi:PAS domain S-box-containing protein
MSQFAQLSPDLVRNVLNAAPDATVIIDASGRIVFANEQAFELFGYNESELAGQPVELFLPERFQTRHITHRLAYSDTRRRRPMGTGLDLFARRRDGSEFPVEISLSPIADGGVALVAAAIRDVTDRQLARLALENARAAADHANLAKSRFLATASHDLRQPLQTLALLNGTLERLTTDPDVREAIDQQEHAIGAMSRLLNALLDISKLESGAIQPEITDFKVAALFEELRSEFAALAANKGLSLAVDLCNDTIRTDPALLGQVLRNLVSNAIKYTRQGCVRLRCLHDAAFVRLEVLDTGIGIPADQLAYIYDEFFQVGVSPNTVRDGYGLGLSIVQRVARLLRLKVDVSSEPGKGSTFSVCVPVSEAANGGASSQAARSTMKRSATRAPHVLLVDDDTAVRGATRLLLRVAGYQVTAAASLAEATERAHALPDIELVITDYHLADNETGIDVIESVREIRGQDRRVILVTGDTSSAIKDLPIGTATRIASKPIHADDLLRLLAELLGDAAPTT